MDCYMFSTTLTIITTSKKHLSTNSIYISTGSLMIHLSKWLGALPHKLMPKTTPTSHSQKSITRVVKSVLYCTNNFPCKAKWLCVSYCIKPTVNAK